LFFHLHWFHTTHSVILSEARVRKAKSRAVEGSLSPSS
jgi:hypothetical protein